MHGVCRHSEAEKGVMEYAEPMADAVQRLAVPLHNEADLDALLSKVNDAIGVLIETVRTKRMCTEVWDEPILIWLKRSGVFHRGYLSRLVALCR